MKATGMMTLEKERDMNDMLMEIPTEETFIKEKLMEKAHILGQMGKTILGIGIEV